MCGQHVHTVRLPMERNAAWSAWMLFMADVHWDNPRCRRDMLKRHLDEAVERQARVFVLGDLFDVMGGRDDPRRSKGKVRPEHGVDDYTDRVIADCAAWWAPYGAALELVTPGNHETALLKRLETDMTGRLVAALRATGSGVAAGTYQGWIRILAEDQRHGRGWRQALRVRYHHGHGGGGVVTKGTLWPQRRAAWWPDADLVVTGHIHEQWSFPVTRERLTDAGRVVQDTQLHLQTATYKDDANEGTGWAVEQGHPPKPLGAWWVRIGYDRHSNRLTVTETRAT
jgi:hypothetical protein